MSKGGENMKINISIDDELLKRIDTQADESYMSRSGLISYACAQYINQVELMRAIKDLSITMRKIADTGEIDEDVKAQLEDFERVSRLFSGK